MTKGIIYYSDCRGDQAVLDGVRRQLRAAAPAVPIVSVTLEKIDAFPWPSYHWVRSEPRGYLTMFRQILEAIEMSSADVLFHCEHDVLYHPSHFDFVPTDARTFYYNQHTWRVNRSSGHAIFYYCNQVSGLCASRLLLLEHYRKIVAHVEQHGFDRSLGFEPGGNKKQQAIGVPAPIQTWMSAQPNIDIKTEFCLTKWRDSPEQFRNKATCQGWQESDRVPGWGVTEGRMDAFLAELAMQGAA